MLWPGFHIHHDIPAWQYLLHGRAFQRDHARCRAEAIELLAFVGLADARDTVAGSLPYGEQRMLEFARALATGPRLLLIDEPAAGLNASEVDSLLDRILTMRGKGVTVVIVEHNMELVMNVADRVLVMDYGQHLFEGVPSDVQKNPAVVAAYLGARADVSTLLAADNLELAYGELPSAAVFRFEINEGEIVALIGANGAGKSTTLRAIAGQLMPRAGTISFRGQDITRLPSHECALLGIALVPEGRRVFPFLTARENLELGGFKYRR